MYVLPNAQSLAPRMKADGGRPPKNSGYGLSNWSLYSYLIYLFIYLFSAIFLTFKSEGPEPIISKDFSSPMILL